MKQQRLITFFSSLDSLLPFTRYLMCDYYFICLIFFCLFFSSFFPPSRSLFPFPFFHSSAFLALSSILCPATPLAPSQSPFLSSSLRPIALLFFPTLSHPLHNHPALSHSYTLPQPTGIINQHLNSALHFTRLISFPPSLFLSPFPFLPFKLQLKSSTSAIQLFPTTLFSFEANGR